MLTKTDIRAREEPTEYVLSLSYGKDSIACLFAIEQLGLPLDRIVHVEVWATDDIHADLPPMVEFKDKADRMIKDRWGIDVEHLCATRGGERLTYEKLFYHIPNRKSPRDGLKKKKTGLKMEQYTDSRSQLEVGAKNLKTGTILGFPMLKGQWCNSNLKLRAFLRAPLHKEQIKILCNISA